MKEYVYVVNCNWRSSDDEVYVFRNVDDAVLFALRTAINTGSYSDDFVEDFSIQHDTEELLIIRYHMEGYSLQVTKEEC